MKQLPFFFLVCGMLVSTGLSQGYGTNSPPNITEIEPYIEMDPVLPPDRDPSVDSPPISDEGGLRSMWDIPVEIKGLLSVDVGELPEGYMGKRISRFFVVTDEKTGIRYQLTPKGRYSPYWTLICNKCIAARRVVFVSGTKVHGMSAHYFTDDAIFVTRIRDEYRSLYLEGDSPSLNGEDKMICSTWTIPVEIKGLLSVDVGELPEGYTGNRISRFFVVTDEKTGIRYQLVPNGPSSPLWSLICNKCVAARRVVFVAGTKVHGLTAHYLTGDAIFVTRIRDEYRCFYGEGD